MKTALITGASRGIGAGCALAFAREGYHVGINHRSSPDDAESIAQQCRDLGVEAEVFAADVSDSSDAQAMVESFVSRFGRIDALVNNAGGALKMPAGGFIDMPVEYWDSQIALNLSAASYCTQAAARSMVAQGVRGAVINISSIHGDITWVRRKALPYSAAKGGLNMMTKALAVELIAYGINVNGIAPGLIHTKALDRYSERDLSGFNRKIPFGGGGSPEDIAELAVFLADKSRSRFIVGQTITVDGGQSIDGSIDSMLDDAF
ncbi:SDR family NAD(P)-dependent oxidoreductase [Microbacterium sp. AK031]|uniref:SDR family NAD(P)-dependent oxidoreductase n=1 Tax=Microbacterium sp. AK031 TaxID=2723076 RepID=UPI0021696F2D|nr:SDR family NAD(P)-dependent oxidoreductase [Microbacterium sp. AK031]MCS3843168.1 NAD(P)-dependent dehydrogenase (short-subunit alcohol dehydrogenase family) [Microbacterium sp. AK031]